jgi:hypothetical protein
LLQLGVPVLTTGPRLTLSTATIRTISAALALTGSAARTRCWRTPTCPRARRSPFHLDRRARLPARPANLMVDCDESEVARFHGAEHVAATSPSSSRRSKPMQECGWLRACQTWRDAVPVARGATHRPAGIHQPAPLHGAHAAAPAADEIIVADCATGSLAAHQILKLKPPQRLMTSGGLGEMGCGCQRRSARHSLGPRRGHLPDERRRDHAHAAGAADRRAPQPADQDRRFLERRLRDDPRHAAESRLPYTAVDRASGVSCPDFVRVAQAFDIPAINGTKSIEESSTRYSAGKGRC